MSLNGVRTMTLSFSHPCHHLLRCEEHNSEFHSTYPSYSLHQHPKSLDLSPLQYFFSRSEQDVMYEVKQNYITLRTQLLLPFVLESCAVSSPGSIPRSGAPQPTQALTSTLPSTPTPTPSPISAPLCPTIRNAYSTLLRVAQMEVQLFDSLFRTPDDDEIKEEESFVVGNGGGGGGLGGTSFKAKRSSLEVVSIIESICNATGKRRETPTTVM